MIYVQVPFDNAENHTNLHSHFFLCCCLSCIYFLSTFLTFPFCLVPHTSISLCICIQRINEIHMYNGKTCKTKDSKLCKLNSVQKKKNRKESELNGKLTLFGALWSPWNGKFSYSPGSANWLAAADDLSRASSRTERAVGVRVHVAEKERGRR